VAELYSPGIILHKKLQESHNTERLRKGTITLSDNEIQHAGGNIYYTTESIQKFIEMIRNSNYNKIISNNSNHGNSFYDIFK
jgi:ATP-dependent exoDNAse (exonuclease V) alpha subunit